MLAGDLPYMLNKLYKILEKNDTHLKIALADKSHPIFKAHFPNFPLLPGFILIDICDKEFNLNIIKLKKASFLENIFPNDIINFELKNDKNQTIIEVKNSEKKLAVICVNNK